MGRAACGKGSRTCGHGGGSPVLRGCVGALFRGWSVYMPVGSSGTESGMKWPDTIDATPIIARRPFFSSELRLRA